MAQDLSQGDTKALFLARQMRTIGQPSCVDVPGSRLRHDILLSYAKSKCPINELERCDLCWRLASFSLLLLRGCWG